MVAAWMVYAVVIALLAGAAAALAEQALRVWRFPGRGVWVAAILASIIGPVVAIVVSNLPQPAAVLTPVVAAAKASSIAAWSTTTVQSLWSRTSRLDPLLLVCWGALSLFALVAFVRSLVESRR